MTLTPQIVIVGAGPAGIRAAETIVHAGLRPIVVDEGQAWGGQIYRQPLFGGRSQRSKKALYGFEAGKAQAVHTAMAKLVPEVDYRPNTLVWSAGSGRIDTLQNGLADQVPFSHIVLATGAVDRVLPIPGWTLPGVFTLGGAQVALKAQGCAIGERVVLAGTGPLLYLVAYQYARAGARVEAVLDTSSLHEQMRASPAMINQPATFAKGLYYIAWLLSRGVRIERGVSLKQITGQDAVDGIVWERDARSVCVKCDAVGLAFGLRPETQIADLLGCKFHFDTLNGCWVPVRDAAGRSSVDGVYLAGDGASISGADAAELSGRQAAFALLKDLNCSLPADHDRQIKGIGRRVRRIGKFRQGIEAAFPVPTDVVRHWPDSLTVCRCEDISAGTLRKCIRVDSISEINRLKALTRVGMGRCQGRMCGEAAMHLLSQEIGKPLDAVGRLRSQSPVKPIFIDPAQSVNSTALAQGCVDE